MHGFFVDIRLYKKAKSVAEPFAFEEYKRKKVREKIEEDRTNRVKMQVRECGRRHNLRSIL
jgi:ribosome biogenesis protein ENP2